MGQPVQVGRAKLSAGSSFNVHVLNRHLRRRSDQNHKIILDIAFMIIYHRRRERARTVTSNFLHHEQQHHAAGSPKVSRLLLMVPSSSLHIGDLSVGTGRVPGGLACPPASP